MFGKKNVNFGNFKTNCGMNSEIHVFVTTYPYKISVLFDACLFTFRKVTANFKYKEYRANGAVYIRNSYMVMFLDEFFTATANHKLIFMFPKMACRSSIKLYGTFKCVFIIFMEK